MKTFKNVLLLFVAVLLSMPAFSQVKTYDENYQQKMGKALDELSPEQMQEVLKYAAEMLEEENARKALACIANKLPKEDQAKLLQKARTTKYFSSKRTAPAVGSRTPEAPIGPTTTMEFKERTFDFGEIDEGEKISHVYKFTNTGNEPLIINNAKGSCGCTVPKWPKEPIAPGATGEMIVEFDTKGKKGKQAKRVTITANTDPAQTFITIKGTVNKFVKN